MPAKTKPAAGTTKITLTLTNDLLAVLDAAAALDNRTRSNLIAYWLHGLKETYPCLSEPRSAQKVAGPPGPCPQGHIRPCERKHPDICGPRS